MLSFVFSLFAASFFLLPRPFRLVYRLISVSLFLPSFSHSPDSTLSSPRPHTSSFLASHVTFFLIPLLLFLVLAVRLIVLTRARLLFIFPVILFLSLSLPLPLLSYSSPACCISRPTRKGRRGKKFNSGGSVEQKLFSPVCRFLPRLANVLEFRKCSQLSEGRVMRESRGSDRRGGGEKKKSKTMS